MLLTIAAQVLSSLTLPPGYALTAINDLTGALLIFSILLAFAANAVRATGRLRIFWILQAFGWAFWLFDQGFWIVYDVILRQDVPTFFAADVLLFLAGAPMLAGLLLRPHLMPSERSAKLGTIDFLLLMSWWVYVYVFFVITWQYIAPSEAVYNNNYDILHLIEFFLIAAVTFGLSWQSSGRWRRFYAFFAATVVVTTISFYMINRAVELKLYYAGGANDLQYLGCFALFTAVALFGSDLSIAGLPAEGEKYSSWLATLAMLAVLSLPEMAIWAYLGRENPVEVTRFRVLITLVTMAWMAFLVFVKHHRLNLELARTNAVLQEASLTDPLTGVRNRRYFTATIDADVAHVLRCYEDGRDPQTRDLVFYLIDADDFKEVNDQYGHDAGDRVLVEMSRRISSAIRNSDILVRWGGEEFLIISRYTDRTEAETLATRVLASVGEFPYETRPGGKKVYRSCSIGWSAYPWLPKNPEAIDYREVLSLADRGLGQAKNTGKNRAVGVSPPDPEAKALDAGRVDFELSAVQILVMGPVTAGA